MKLLDIHIPGNGEYVMQTEAKLVVVLIVIVGFIVGLYFYKSYQEKPIEFKKTPLPAPLKKAESQPKVSLPISEKAEKRPIEQVTKRSQPALSPTEKAEPVKPVTITIDVERPAGEKKTSKLPESELPVAKEPAAEVIPNKPASILPKMEVEPTVETTQPVEAKPEIGKTRVEVREPIIHTVKSGDSLYKIAEKYYGDGNYWRAILKANPEIRNPDHLMIGQKLLIPPKEEAEFANLPQQVPSGVNREELRPYKVKQGESFYTIARDILGDASRWKEIYRINKLAVANDPRNLRAGQVILIPRK